MSPASSCFSLETSVTTSPLSTAPLKTVELLHLGSSRVEDTTYLGRLFNLSAHSPLRDSHRTAKYSSLRRPSSRASASSAWSSSTLAHSSRSLSPIWRNQPPCLKPSSPVGSWTTPSSETFSLTMILPISVLLWLALSATTEAETATSGKWAPTDRPVHDTAGIYTGSAAKVRLRGDASVGAVTADLISRAGAGDGDAFRELTEPYRRELQVHCYRMLGSFQDAEDALQDTLLDAWQGLGGFEGCASIRTWLYRIATNRCLKALRSASRRHAKEWNIPAVEPPEPNPPPAAGSPSEDAIVAKFVRAYESADLDAVVALLTDDVFVSMPPMPLEYEGRDVVARFCASLFGAGRRFDLVPTRANGQPAFGVYLRAPDGIRHGTGLYVLTLPGDRICALPPFQATRLPWFRLPRSPPTRYPAFPAAFPPPRPPGPTQGRLGRGLARFSEDARASRAGRPPGHPRWLPRRGRDTPHGGARTRPAPPATPSPSADRPQSPRHCRP